METTDVKNDSWERCSRPYDYDCVIVAAGDFPTHTIPLSVLEDTPYVICCDGAIHTLLSNGTAPHAIVGDGDSLPAEYKEFFADRVHQESEQEYNDLTKATRFAVQQGFKKIAYVGCTGKREDHTFGNVSLMSFYQREFHVRSIMYTDHGTFTPCHGTQAFQSFPRQQVSIFSLNATTISSEGLRWQAYPYREWWQGTLNEALSDTFTICADGDYIVFQTYEPKK